MMSLLLFAVLIVGFYLLGKSADVVITQVKKVGEKLKIHVFFLGLLLGLLTSLPELTVGVNALIQGAQEISLGNLLGGVLVLLSFVLGGSIVINRRISLDGELTSILAVALYLMLPVLLASDGMVSLGDGAALIVGYLVLIAALYQFEKKRTQMSYKIVIREWSILKDIVFAICGLIFVMLLSTGIVRVTLMLIDTLHLPVFVTGLVLLSIGTNLPEIIITLRSFKRHLKELSLSNIIGSSAANVLLIGVFATMREVTLEINTAFLVYASIMGVLLICVMLFARSGKSFSMAEGVILLLFYVAFVVLQSTLLLGSRV